MERDKGDGPVVPITERLEGLQVNTLSCESSSKSSRLYKLSWTRGWLEQKPRWRMTSTWPTQEWHVMYTMMLMGMGMGMEPESADSTSTTAMLIDSADQTAHDKERTTSPSLENRLRTGPATPHTHSRYPLNCRRLTSASTGTFFGITYHGIRRPVKAMC